MKNKKGKMKNKKNHNRGRLFLISHFSFLILLIVSCGAPNKNKQYDPAKVNFTTAVNPLFDGHLYPSLILALNQKTESGEQGTENAAAHSPLSALHSPLTVSVTAPTNNAVLRIVVDSSDLNYVTILQEILPVRGETYTFSPSLKWKYDRLRLVRQHRPLDLTLTCYINDEETDIRNLHLDIRSVNECPLSFRLKNSDNKNPSSIVDTRFLFAAYVNEEHPQIPQILSEALSQGIVSRFQGYQAGTKDDVQKQVLAIWHNTLLRGLSYSSISCTSNPSTSTNVQHIRFFDEVWNTRQANCIDACVYFASILRKIGLRPVIFVEPCHAYLGYYTDKKQKNIALLETTVTSWTNYPDLLRNLDPDGYLPDEQLQKIAKYLTPRQLQDYADRRLTTDQLLILVSSSLFDKASTYNQESYNNTRQHFADPDAITFQQLDIESLRQTVQPIN